jgi:demethylmenaquinone methyltransferase/2-methoxy-6-polyprenyl-1,4-benzoquinol methylase
VEYKPGRPSSVRALFDDIAGRYDLANTVITLGQIGKWRRRLVDGLDLRDAKLVLDLASGTGDLALLLAKKAPDARIVGVDLSAEMLRRAREKAKRAGVGDRFSPLLADVNALPFKEGSVDCVTNAFLLRHLASLPAAFREFKRVLRPGKPLAALELTQPTTPILRHVFTLLFHHVIPLLGAVITGNLRAFRYLLSSWKPFPGYRELLKTLEDVGFVESRYELMWMSGVAAHYGVKPESED